MNILYFLILSIATLLEGAITSIPLVLDVLLVFYILKRTSGIFFLAFVSGIILDVFSVRTLGSSSAFFIAFVFLVLLYQRKFEIATYPFVFFVSFVGGFFYLWIFEYDHIFQQAIISLIIALMLFKFSMKPEIVNIK